MSENDINMPQHDTDMPENAAFQFLDLPLEVQTLIMSNLMLKDLIQASLSCRALYDIVQIEKIWEKRALEDFGIVLKPKNQRQSAKTFYQKILNPYGHFLGLLQRHEISFWGSIHQLVFDDSKNGWKLLLLTWDPPPGSGFDDNLVMRTFLSIELDSAGEVCTIIEDEFLKSDVCHLSSKKDEKSFQITLDVVDWTEVPEQWSYHMSQFLKRETGNSTIDRNRPEFILQMGKYLHIFHHRNAFVLKPFLVQTIENLPFPANTPHLVQMLQPGVFKGTYGPHGIEIIHLHYSGNDDNQLTGTKLIGDPNVPYGEVSFIANLNEPILFTNTEDQADATHWSKENLPLIDPATSPFEMHQPFIVPESFHIRALRSYNNCKARYLASCQVAEFDHTNPQFIEGQFVVFSENTFAVLFNEIRSFSMYQRVTQNISAMRLDQI